MSLAEEFDYIAGSPLQAKFKLMLQMVYVDIFSNIWSKYVLENSGHRSQRERFATWCDAFVFCESNPNYGKHPAEYSGLDGNLFYKIRNSLLHFGGLPNFGGKAIFISEDSRKRFFEKYSQQVSEEGTIVLSSGSLFGLVARGIALTLQDLVSASDQDSEKQDKFLSEIFDRIQKESAMPIHLTKRLGKEPG